MSSNLETKLKVSGDSTSAQAALRSTEEGLGRVEKQAKKTGDESAISGEKLAGAFRAAAGALVVSQFIQANRTVEDLALAFKTVTGSAEAGAEAMQHAREIADQLGGSVTQTADAYAQYLAAIKGTSLEGEAGVAVFDAVSAAMAAMGRSSEATSRGLLALSQMTSKGTISMEELRGQLGEALPGALTAMAKGLGISTADLIKLTESGKLLAEDGLPALARALDQIGGSGGKLRTFSAAWERLKNTVDIAFPTIGQGELWTFLTKALELAALLVTSLSIEFVRLGQTVSTVARAVASMDFSQLGESLRTVAADARVQYEELGKRLENLQPAAGKAASGIADAGEKAGQAGANFVKLGLDIATGVQSLQDWAQRTETANKATQAGIKGQLDLAAALGREAEVRRLTVQAAQEQADAGQKQIIALRGEIGMLTAQKAEYDAIIEAGKQLSADKEKQRTDIAELIQKRQEELRLLEGENAQFKVAAQVAKAEAQAKADQGRSVDALGDAYRKAADEVKRLEAEQRAGADAAGQIARTQEEMAQIRERLFTASANAALGDAAWAEKVRLLQGEESRLGDELDRLIDVQARGAAAGKVSAQARDLVTKREIEYRAAIDESIRRSEERLQQMQRETEIIQRQLRAKQAQAAGAEQINRTEAETLKVKAAIQQALGNETRAQELLAQAKREEEDASRAVVAQKRLEAQAAEEAAQAKRDEVAELEKQLALLKEKANIDGIVTDAEREQIQTSQQALDLARAQSQELDATAKAAKQYAQAVAEGAQANLDLADAQQQAERSARINAESMVTQNAQVKEWTNLTAIVRARYYELSEAAGHFFDVQMAGIQTLEQWRDALSDRQFERVRRLYEEQAGGVERLTEALQSGTLSAEDLNAELARAERLVQGVGLNFNLLDASQLNGLKSAIEAARGQLEQMQDQLQAMNEDAAAGLRSLQSEIASLQGDQVRVAALEHQERLLALQEKLNAAVAAGNEEATALFQQQIALEDQRYKLQLDQLAAQAGDNQAAKLRAQMEKEKVNAARDVADATKRAEDAAQATNQAAKDGESGFKGIYEWVMGAEKASRDLSENLLALTKAPIKIPIQFTYGGNQDLLRALANALGLANRAVPGGLN